VSENIHRFGFYESHELDLKTRLKELANQPIRFVQSPNYGSFDSFIESHNSNVSNGKYKVRRYSTPYRVNRDVEIRE